MSTTVLFCAAFILCVLFRILNVTSTPKAPELFSYDSKFMERLVKACPHLLEPYVPVQLWGFSGHIQSIVHAMVGRVKSRERDGVRYSVRMGDGATLTWDEYSPLEPHPSEDNATMAVCPGIGNSSESVYVQAFVHYAASNGYHCIVLNHLGALKSVRVTSPRIFSYGGTEEFRTMVSHHLQRYNNTKIVVVGFSMGANIVTKYLGEEGHHASTNIVGAISICQGYDALCFSKYMLEWTNFRRVYFFMMTENMKRILMRNKATLLADDFRAKHPQLDERKIFSVGTLVELDEVYTRHVMGYESVEKLYHDLSCARVIDNISVPIIFINATDDPLTPGHLLDIPRRFSETHNSSLYIETSHGGHLGFFEKGLLYPHEVTWLDRTVVQLSHGLTAAE